MNRTRTSPARLVLAVGAALALLAGCVASPGSSRRDAFTSAEGRDPTPRTLHMMARLLIEQGKNAQAEYVLASVIENHPDHLPSYIELASLQGSLGRLEHAIATLEAARQIAPDDPVIANNLGLLYLQQSRYALALQVFSDATDLVPNEARYVSNKALALAMLGRVDEARAAYELVLTPDEAMLNIAVALEAVGKYREAIAAYSKAVRLGASLETELDPGIQSAVAAQIDDTPDATRTEAAGVDTARE